MARKPTKNITRAKKLQAQLQAPAAMQEVTASAANAKTPQEAMIAVSDAAHKAVEAWMAVVTMSRIISMGDDVTQAQIDEVQDAIAYAANMGNIAAGAAMTAVQTSNRMLGA